MSWAEPVRFLYCDSKGGVGQRKNRIEESIGGWEIHGRWDLRERWIARRTNADSIGIIGSRGGVTQVRVEFMDDQTRSIIRNVKGPGMLCIPVQGKHDLCARHDQIRRRQPRQIQY